MIASDVTLSLSESLSSILLISDSVAALKVFTVLLIEFSAAVALVVSSSILPSSLATSLIVAALSSSVSLLDWVISSLMFLITVERGNPL